MEVLEIDLPLQSLLQVLLVALAMKSLCHRLLIGLFTQTLFQVLRALERHCSQGIVDLLAQRVQLSI